MLCMCSDVQVCFWHCTLTAGQLDSQQKEVSMTPPLGDTDRVCESPIRRFCYTIIRRSTLAMVIVRASDKSVKWDDWGAGLMVSFPAFHRTPGSLEGARRVAQGPHAHFIQRGSAHIPSLLKPHKRLLFKSWVWCLKWRTKIKDKH